MLIKSQISLVSSRTWARESANGFLRVEVLVFISTLEVLKIKSKLFIVL